MLLKIFLSTYLQTVGQQVSSLGQSSGGYSWQMPGGGAALVTRGGAGGGTWGQDRAGGRWGHCLPAVIDMICYIYDLQGPSGQGEQ